MTLTFAAAVAATVVLGGLVPEDVGTVKVAWFDRVISPEVGTDICGYDAYQHSVGKISDLHMSGLCVDDGERKTLLVSFDLLGMDTGWIRRLRAGCAGILKIDPTAVLLTCTHTHGGPETYWQPPYEDRGTFNEKYLVALEKQLLEAVRGLTDWRDCAVAYYSIRVDENRNRRYVTADNRGSFTPHRKEMERLAEADGFADKELGVMMFYEKTMKADGPCYVIGNYAAHPLATHSPGVGGLRITSDYPGYFRDYIRDEMGCASMFISGACGDMVPKGDELGRDAARQTGVNLAKGAIAGCVDVLRNPARFIFRKPRTAALSRTFRSKVRNKFRGKLYDGYKDAAEIEMEVQCVAIGDVCFVGVPGELSAEIGQEIKWHSPFRRTYIAYMSTGCFEYQSEPSALVAGGYEPMWQWFNARHALNLLTAAEDAMFELRPKVFPEDAGRGEPYPDFVDYPRVNIPQNR